MSGNNLSRGLLAIIFLSVVAVGSYFGGGLKITSSHAPSAAQEQAEFTITPQRRIHILTGDEKGGGHKYGAGFPGKTEFPKEWSDDKIIATAAAIANDKKLPLRPSGRYWLKMKEVDGVQVRVVLNKEKGEVVTSYPLNRPRNPSRSRRQSAEE
jgi:hypothetical protein